MALRWIDSFDGWRNTSGEGAYGGPRYETSWIRNNTPTTSQFRTGTQGMELFGSNTNFYIGKILDNQATWIAGWACKKTGTAPTNWRRIWYLADGGTTQVSLYLSVDNRLGFYRGDGATQLAYGTTVMAMNTWDYIEVKCTIHDTTGSFEVRINGVTEISGTNVDTQVTANSYADRMIWSNGQGNDVTPWLDDLYICDGTGSAPTNDFLGDIMVEALFPNGNGNSSQFVGSDGNSTDNYLLVDEQNQPDGDTTYVQSSTVAQKDTYAMGNLTATAGTVYGVQVNSVAKKTLAGTRTIVHVSRESGGTEADSAAKALSLSYVNNYTISESKPSTGAWTISDINNAEFGVKVNS